MGTALLWVCFVLVLCGIGLAGGVVVRELRRLLVVGAAPARPAVAAAGPAGPARPFAVRPDVVGARVPTPRDAAGPRRGIGALTLVDDVPAAGPRRGLGARPSLVAAPADRPADEARGFGRSLGA